MSTLVSIDHLTSNSNVNEIFNSQFPSLKLKIEKNDEICLDCCSYFTRECQRIVFHQRPVTFTINGVLFENRSLTLDFEVKDIQSNTFHLNLQPLKMALERWNGRSFLEPSLSQLNKMIAACEKAFETWRQVNPNWFEIAEIKGQFQQVEKTYQDVTNLTEKLNKANANAEAQLKVLKLMLREYNIKDGKVYNQT